MILKYFKLYLDTNNLKPSIKVLSLWLQDRINSSPRQHEDKILQAELFIGENRCNNFLVIAKSESGRKLLESLYNYVLSCENLEKARENHNKQ